MKKLAPPILVFALLGIASMLVPGPHGSLLRLYAEFDSPRLVLLVLSFVAAAVACGASLRGVRARWTAYLALFGFVLAFVKARVWTLLQQFSDSPTPLKLHAIAIVGGVIFTLLATAVGDERESAEATS
jgi:hypothetical protein